MAEISKPKGDSFIVKFLKQRTGKIPLDVPASAAQDLADPLKKKDLHKRILTAGSMFDSQRLARIMSDALATSYFRRTFYRECEMCSSHPLVAGALDLYVDAVCATSGVTNRIVWVNSENDKNVANVLTQFLEDIYVEERIRDWAGQLAMFGDNFVENIGRQGIGVGYLDDNIHPSDMERIDINGRLEGYIRTGLYTDKTEYVTQLEPPWKYCHFKINGVTKRVLNTALGIFGEPGKMFSLEQSKVQDKKFRITTRYGVSLLTPSIPIYKRLKLAEDSVLMSRMTRGMLWYLYKIMIKGGNLDSAAELVQLYAEYLKRNLNAGLNLDTGERTWKDKWQPILAQAEDLFVPESDDIQVAVEKLGGEPDIKAIVDVDLQINQLLGSLRVSKSMLGITDDLPGAIGEGAANRISINFAKNAQRVQSGLRQGIKRLCQVHLAYRNLNPDPTRFDIQFAEISSAEEEELKNALETGVDVVDKIMDVLEKSLGENTFDKVKALEYLNQKVLKLNDLDLKKLQKNIIEGTKDTTTEEKKVLREAINSDLLGYLPIQEKEDGTSLLTESLRAIRDADESTLSDEQKALKQQIAGAMPARVFMVKDNLEVTNESKLWMPMNVRVKQEVETKKNG